MMVFFLLLPFFWLTFFGRLFWSTLFGQHFLVDSFWSTLFGRLFLVDSFWSTLFGRLFLGDFSVEFSKTSRINLEVDLDNKDIIHSAQL